MSLAALGNTYNAHLWLLTVPWVGIDVITIF